MKTVVISGASQGLGLVMANTFAQADWQTIATGRKPRPKQLRPNAKYVQLDSADTEAVTHFWRKLKAEVKDEPLALINNAGGYLGAKLIETKLADYQNQMNSIFFTSAFNTHQLILNFKRAKIFNIISASGVTPSKENSAYGAAKAAQQHFFQSLQKEFPPESYQICNIYPDKIATAGPDSTAMDPLDLARFILELAQSARSFYLREVFVYALTKNSG